VYAQSYGEEELVKVTTKHELGLLLAERRRQLGMTQQEFADFVGVPRLWVAQVETGKTNPTLSRLLEVVRLAGLSLSLDPPPDDRDRPQADLDGAVPSPRRHRVDLDDHLSRFADAAPPRT
jgi:transcriptional regulator with XRE-family HTH domain